MSNCLTHSHLRTPVQAPSVSGFAGAWLTATLMVTTLGGMPATAVADAAGGLTRFHAPAQPVTAFPQLSQAIGDEDENADDAADDDTDAPHAALFAEDLYPSANTCAACHPRQYEEWSVSQHAYAQLSPIYMAMQTTINAATSATNGDFCIRCHNPIGMNLNESIYVSNLERPASSREGITCSVCHRVNQNYGKISGRLPLQTGDILTPVYGPTGDKELKKVISNPEFRVTTDPNERGRRIHKADSFFALTTPAFCGSCHDVTLFNGFRLEEAFSEYKQTQAAAEGTTCQDCHMGRIQGQPSGYDQGPAAVVAGKETTPRKLTNHFFAGPDYSVIHPGIFPHNVEAADLASLEDWLAFDWQAGWGTEAFEAAVENGDIEVEFPDAWFDGYDREEARAIIDSQLERLEWARQKRLEVLQSGFKLDAIQVTDASRGDGIGFRVDVRNGTNGHGVPTGFDAERAIFLQVTVTDDNGTVVYRSGDRDPNGDLRDKHSLYVKAGRLDLDDALFSLQSKFVVRMIRGGEREQVLAVNTSLQAQPMVRPERRATTIYGRPNGARKHKKTIEPLGSRTAVYSVDPDDLTASDHYHVTIRLISQMVPVHLIHAIKDHGIDYGMSPKDLAEGVVAGASVIAEQKVVVGLDGSIRQSASARRPEPATLPQ